MVDPALLCNRARDARCRIAAVVAAALARYVATREKGIGIMVSALPFDDLRNLARQFPEPDRSALAGVTRVNEAFAARAGSLGRTARLAEWLGGWTGRGPAVNRPVVAMFAGTHGVARGLPGAAGDVQALIERCAAGGGAVNQACVAHDLGLKIFDLALDVPTDDFTTGDALDERGAAATIAFGMEAIAGGIDLLVLTGFGGAGGALSNAAIFAALLGGRPADWLEDGDEHAAGRVAAALDLHRAHLADPLEVLRRLGGRETAALVGAIVAARMEKVPVLLDGPAALAAAAVVRALAPGGLDHCLVGDGGSSLIARAAQGLGLATPVVALGMATSDGAGGAIAAGVVRAAALVHFGAAEMLRAGGSAPTQDLRKPH